MSDEKVFSDINRYKDLSKKCKTLEGKYNKFKFVKSKVNDLRDFILIAETEDDSSIVVEIDKELNSVESLVSDIFIDTLLCGEYDSNNAIIKIHSGAGGTEACDWVQMLFRMYSLFCEKNNFKVKVLDSLDGEGAGLKSITFMVNGENAYGYFKGESGVHRLVRISPFDSNKRRHTSFASVEVMPEIEESTDIIIKDEDIRIDTFRASGAGGQYINTTDSAIRITHLPTNIVVTCQNERSQLQNKETAMKMLKGKLISLELEKQQQKALEIKGESKKIEWGSQIRSYVFCPYKLVKDLRTNYETSNLDDVMNGNLKDFIFEYLKWIN